MTFEKHLISVLFYIIQAK